MDESFASQLRTHRIAAELSQEALAEAARISTSAIEKYERGLRISPHPQTVASLADALKLSGQARSDFENSTRRKAARGRIAGSLPARENDVDRIVEFLRGHRVVTHVLREVAREICEAGIL